MQQAEAVPVLLVERVEGTAGTQQAYGLQH